MQELLNILTLFRNVLKKLNNSDNTKTPMFDSIYHIKSTLKSHFCRENVKIFSLYTQGC